MSETAVIYDEVRGTQFKEQMTWLLILDFVKKGQNLTIFGAPGSGKTYIAAILARKSCMIGYSTAYYSTNDILNDFKMVYGSPTYKTKIITLPNKKLLILDDFCLTSLDTAAQTILFDILSRRYNKNSTIIVSQKSPSKWLEVLGNTALTQSIVERASTNNFTLMLLGESRRH